LPFITSARDLRDLNLSYTLGSDIAHVARCWSSSAIENPACRTCWRRWEGPSPEDVKSDGVSPPKYFRISFVVIHGRGSSDWTIKGCFCSQISRNPVVMQTQRSFRSCRTRTLTHILYSYIETQRTV
jgi:hypothetical protein